MDAHAILTLIRGSEPFIGIYREPHGWIAPGIDVGGGTNVPERSCLE